MSFSRPAVVASIIAVVAAPTFASDTVKRLPDLQVTATRSALDLDVLPASVSVISGEELRARGAQNLSDALAGVAGVEIAMGGDNGPAGSVPSFWGLREFDAFLLVVDGVPAGGAFNPALSTLDLNNVERIEVMRGAAPVMYGATSFVGVIHVLHYPAGQSSEQLWVSGGGVAGHLGSFSLGGARALADDGKRKRSLSASIDQVNLADKDADYLKLSSAYRSAEDSGQNRDWDDLELSLVRQRPDSPVVFEDGAPTTKTPRDANHNPADAVFEELRTQWTTGRSRQQGEVRSVTLASDLALLT